MLYSDRGLRALLATGDLVIEPLLEEIQPASIELHLAKDILVLPLTGLQVISPRSPPARSEYVSLAWTEYAEDQVATVCLGAAPVVCLASTIEWVELGSAIAGKVEGKSSLGRLGLQIENAGFIDPGFRGNITLELVNMSGTSFKLYAGMRIAQLLIMQLTEPAMRVYGDPALKSKYQGQQGVTPGKRQPLSYVTPDPIKSEARPPPRRPKRLT